MDFKIIAANNYATASKSIIDMLKQADQCDLSVNHVVVSNDRCRMSSEFELLDALGGSFNTQVLTFARLTSRLMNEKTFISKQSAIMLINRLAEQLSDDFLCFTKSYDTPGFAANIYETISQLKYSAISPDRIDPASFQKNLQLKMHDIKLLYQAYEDFIKDRYIDSGAKLHELIKVIPQSDFVKNSYFYIKDFDNFSTQEVLIIRQLVIYSKGVVVALPYVKGRRVYVGDSFGDMLAVASGLEITPDVTYLVDNQPNYVSHVEQNLFDYKTEFRRVKTSDVIISKESDVFAEAEVVARYIVDKTRHGARYKDFLIVTGDVSKYAYAFERVFGKYDIAYFLDNKISLVQHALSQYILDIFKTKQNGYRREDCFAVMKNCFYATDDDVCQFENFCLKNNLRFFGNAFEGQSEQEKHAEKIRSQFVEYIESFDIKAMDSARGYAQKIKDFLCDVNTIVVLEQLVQKQDKIDAGLCKISKQVREKLLTVVDTLMALFGDEPISREKFVSLLQAGIEAESISIIPLYNDCVVVTNVGKSRANGNKHLIIVGANDGNFPVVKGDTKIVNDGDIDALKKHGINVTPKIESENTKEKFNVFQLLTAPRQSLFVTYIATGDKATPCLAVEELSKMFETNDDYIKELKYSGMVFGKKQAKERLVEEMSKIADGNSNGADLAGRLCVALDDKNIGQYLFADQVKQNVAHAKQLLMPKGKTSVTKIETFYSCPYRYFLANGLKLQKRDMGELKSVDTGVIIHDVLENFVKQRFVDKIKPDEDAKTFANNLVDEAFAKPQYQYLTKHPKLAYVMQKIRKEAVAVCNAVDEQMQSSLFKPYMPEQAFGFDSKESWPAVKIVADENEILLNGKIDRIDVCDDKFVLVDYKTGSASFNEAELYVGKKLQLLTYVKAALTNLKKDCAGFFYMPVNDNFAEGEGKHFGYIGRVENQADVLYKLDMTSRDKGKSKLLDKSLTKEGVLSKSTKMGVSKEILDVYIKYTDIMLQNAVKDMADGFIAQHPYGNTCDFCDFCKVCNYKDFYGDGEKVSGIDADVLAKVVQNGI